MRMRKRMRMRMRGRGREETEGGESCGHLQYNKKRKEQQTT
jgi:hypothetical protein